MKLCTLEEIYNRNNDLKKEDILLLQEWMSKESHLPKISEMYLIAFLHACYYKIEPAKVCIENFYTLRGHWKEFSLDRDIYSKQLQQTLHSILVTVLPIRTKHNHLVVYSRLMNPSMEVFNNLAQMKLFDMITWAWYRYVGVTEGQMLLLDMQGLTLSHLMRVNLVHLKKHMYYVQEALPVRLKAVHIVNVSSLSEKVVSMVKPFLRKDMMELIHMHPKIDSVYDYIPKEALPDEYGGKAGTFKELHEQQIKLAEEHAQYFKDEEKEIADESKRQGKPKNLDNIFGIEGTFKKLDID